MMTDMLDTSTLTLMHQELAEAPQVSARLLTTQSPHFAAMADHLRASPPDLIMTNARGSSDHASVFGKYLFMQRLGIPVLSGSPSLSSIYGQVLRLNNALCISVSQSGQSPDIVETARAAVRSGARTCAFTNSPNSSLARVCERTVDLSAGTEKSVAATKSYIASLVAYLALIGHWQDETLLNDLEVLPDGLAEAISLDWSDALPVLRDCSGLFVIGRGAGLGIANEAALKFKETCQIHAEAFSSAECSHGPLAMVGPRFPALIFVQNDAARDGTIALGQRMVDMGAPVLVAGADLPGAIRLPTVDVVPAVQLVTMIQSFYKMVADLAILRGQNPDAPPALKKVTETR